MDEGQEEEEKNLGAYEKGDFSDIRPGFYHGRATEEDEARVENGGVNRTKAEPSPSLLKDKEESASKGFMSGGKNSTADKVSSGVEKVANVAGKMPSRFAKIGSAIGKVATKLKAKKIIKIAPVLVVLIIIVAVGAFTLEALFPFGYADLSKEKNNSTTISTTLRTDTLVGDQLALVKSDDAREQTIFDNMGMSDLQKESFKQGGLSFETTADGSQDVFTYTGSDDKKYVVMADSALSKYMSSGEIAENSDAVTDSGQQGISEEEAKAMLLADLGEEGSDTVVLSFSQALNNAEFKQKYMVGTKFYRGDTSGWFTKITDMVMQRLGISRNNLKDFHLSPDNSTNTEAVIGMTSEMPAASEASDLDKLSLREKCREIADNSRALTTGAAMCFNEIESVIASMLNLREVSAASIFLESIDKTKAGEGNGAPLTALSNMVVESGGASTPGMNALFGKSTLDQSSAEVQKVSAQAHGNDDSILSSGIIPDQNGYFDGFYVGNTNDQGSSGAIPIIKSVINKISDWVSNLVKSVVNFLVSLLPGPVKDFLSGTGGSEKIEAAMADTINEYNEMATQTFFNGNDTAVLGEALVSGTERIMNEKAKSAGQVIGDETALLASYRAQQEVIAEKAEYERNTKSPFDASSQYTFFGSIVNSLIPFAVSSRSTALTTTVSSIGSAVSGSLSQILPTSDAISEAHVQRGDCVFSNNIGAVTNPHCNNYYNSDLQLATSNAKSLYQQVLGMRYTKDGYFFRSHTKDSSGRAVEYDSNAPDYGKGPLNASEGNACVKETALFLENGRWVSKPIAWAYHVHPNFEYEGYKTGWRNRTSAGAAKGVENAKNDIEPTACELDIAKDENQQPIINQNGPLGLFILMSGQRGSEWGVADSSNIELLAKSDFTLGRVHPCIVGSLQCFSSKYTELGWGGSSDKEELEKKITRSEFMSRWVGGTAYVAYNGTGMSNFGSMNTGFTKDDRFKDKTRLDENDEPMYFWDEMRLYQSYSELLEWMESAGIINTSGVAKTAQVYYDENPLDNSYEGIIARYSGMKKDQVVAIFDLMQYVAWLKNYDATALYPTPRPLPEKIENNSNEEIMGQAEKITALAGVVYDEMRYRTVTV